MVSPDLFVSISVMSHNHEPYIRLKDKENEINILSYAKFLLLHAILHDIYGKTFTPCILDQGFCY